MSIGIKEIAQKAGVSKATVSLAINNSNLVKVETRERILEIAREFDYIPDFSARSLAKNRSTTIGVVVPDIKNEYYSRLASFLEEAIRTAGYITLFALSNENYKQEEQVIRELISQNVEGIVILPINTESGNCDYLKVAKRHNIPVVFASAYYSDLKYDCVMADLEKASYEVTRYLLERGKRNIVFLSRQRNAVSSKLRIQGIQRAFAEQGLVFSEENIVTFEQIDYDVEAYQYIESKKWLEGSHPADAFIATNDLMALSVINALQAQKYRVPEDISVVGYDNMSFSRVSPVKITTIDQNLEEISKRSVELLLSKINGEADEAPTTVALVETKLILRDSTPRDMGAQA